MVLVNVVAGVRREVVGAIRLEPGLRTSVGRVKSINEKSISFQNEDGTIRWRQKDNLDDVTVRHSHAVRRGYPHTQGCIRKRVRNIRRGQEVVAA